MIGEYRLRMAEAVNFELLLGDIPWKRCNSSNSWEVGSENDPLYVSFDGLNVSVVRLFI